MERKKTRERWKSRERDAQSVECCHAHEREGEKENYDDVVVRR